MKKLILFFIVFSIIFIFDLLFVVLNKKKRNKIFSSYGATFIKNKYKVNFENVDKKKFALFTSIADAFICAVAYTIMSLIENIYLSFVIAAVALIILIILVYGLIGVIYKKKEGKKNV